MDHTSTGSAVERLAAQAAERPHPLELIGRVQPYAWGGFTYLRELTGLDLPPGTPAAEWWIGAHPVAPSTVRSEHGDAALDRLIARAPRVLLGDRVIAKFGPRLPFLLKVLDVREMLSIQAHPSQAQAEAGFARENAAGTPLDAPNRNYRDANHKPEAQVALTPFWMLCGFREPTDVRRVLAARPELHPLTSQVEKRLAAGAAANAVVRELYELIMHLAPDQVGPMLDGLSERVAQAREGGTLDEGSPDFWVLKARDQCRAHGASCDPGLLSIYLLNLVHLAPGESTFLGAGMLHAYLRGAAVEIMANSDNVLRGGLTPKHVDVTELLSVLSFDPTSPRVSAGEPQPGEGRVYSGPAPEFALARHDLRAGGPAAFPTTDGPELLITTDGEARLDWQGGTIVLRRGAAVFLPPGLQGTLASEARAVVFRAFVPRSPSSGALIL